MSSFYGQMRWQDFQRFFYNFTLNNNHFSANNMFNENPVVGQMTIESGYVAYLQPNEDFATLKINAANHWIKLSPLDSIGDQNITYGGFSLFHNKADTQNTESVKVFDITTIPANQEATILKNGDGFRILELKFDKAGHYSESVSLEPTYFQLPPQIIRVNFSKDLYVNDDQKFHFQEDDWVNLQVSDDGKVLNFAHKIIFNSNFDISGFEKPEGEEQYQVVAKLKEGDYFSTDRMVYDKAGHLISTTRVYYQLPISEVIGDIADLSAVVTQIQETLETLDGVVKENSQMVVSHEERLAAAENMLGGHDEMHSALITLERGAEGQKFTVAQGFDIVSRYLKETVENANLKGIYARLTLIEEKLGM